MATAKLRDPEIAISYVEGHDDFGYAIAHLIKDLRKQIAALGARLGEMEQRLSLGVRPDEWVQGNGLLPADAYDVGCTCGVGSESSPEHDEDCPRFIPF